MSFSASPGSGGSIIPKSTLWRFLLATILLAVATAVAAMLVSRSIGRRMVYRLQDDSAYSVLRSAVELVAGYRIREDRLRVFFREQRKELLNGLVVHVISLLDSYEEEVRERGRPLAEARSTSFRRLNRVVGPRVPVFVLDADLRLVIHPRPEFRDRPVAGFRNCEGETVFKDLSDRARAAGRNETVFTLYAWAEDPSEGRGFRLAAARYYRPWDVVVCAAMPMGDIEEAMAERRRIRLNDLRARLGEMGIMETGYVFCFDEDCTYIGHPVNSGESFRDLRPPGSDETLCSMLKAAAVRPWGENKCVYEAALPGDSGGLAGPAVSWVTRDPVTGWYVAATAFEQEIEAALPRFIWSIFLPALGAIVILAFAVALVLQRFLRPIQDLVRVCREVSGGDLEIRAKEDFRGEMGFLARHFNIMVHRLGQARDKDEQRKKELETLNRNLEAMVEARTEDLRNKTLSLEEANRRLMDLDRMKSEFLSSVSHELRTPLTSILGFAKLIYRDFQRFFNPLSSGDPSLEKMDLRIRYNLRIIEQEGERLTRLINEVLDLNKIESGQAEWRVQDLDLAEVIRQAARGLGEELANKPDLGLEIDAPGDLPRFKGDPERIGQVLSNLLGNAVKFTKAGRVRVEARVADNGRLRVRVSDTGVGIAEKDLDRVFDKFHQAHGGDATEGKPRGTGLGLAICRQIVEHYGGAIWARSEPGKGSVFTLELPIGESGG
ncbi:MAG: cache domain-containing protein [Desulfovibrionaceae bacterium]|nr:cache domain-containing protein [Desulfovibrionaceae bacterium]